MSARFVSIEELMRDGQREPRPSPEGQVARLQEAMDRWVNPVPYPVGDLITPRADSSYHGRGDPHLVIANRPPVCDFTFSPGDNAYGSAFDTRVLSVSDSGSIAAHWVESSAFEPYVSPE